METLMHKTLIILLATLVAGTAFAQHWRLTDFTYFTDIQRTVEGDPVALSGRIAGRIHSNDDLIFRGGEFGRATSAGTITLEGDNGFTEGFADQQAQIGLDIDIQRFRALARHIHSNNGHLMTWIRMEGAQGIDVFQYPVGGWPSESLLFHMAPPGEGGMFVQGEVEVEGVLAGSITIGSEGNMWLVDNVRYDGSNAHTGDFREDAMPHHRLGLLSERNIIIKDNLKNGQQDGNNAAPNDFDRHSIVINAAICTPNGSFTFEHQNFEGDLYQGPSPDMRGTIYLKGCVIQRRAGYTHTDNHNFTGYGISYSYDSRFFDHPPPGFETGNQRFSHRSYGTLDLRKGVYDIGETTIRTLIVEAGTELNLYAEGGVTVTDSLILNGTEAEPIIIIGDMTSVRVGGARWAGSRISHVRSPEFVRWTFEEGNHVINAAEIEGDLTFGGDLQIDSCRFPKRVRFLHAGEVAATRSVFDGGILATIIEGAATFTNCTIVNSARAGIETDQTEDVTLVNCIVAHNRWGVLSSGLRDPIIRYSDITDNYVDDYVDCDPGEGCFSEDPRFVNARAKDYHLASNSSCIDSGDPASPRDPDGTRADVGALFHPHPMTAPDVAQSFHGLSLAVAPNPFNDQTRLMIDADQAGEVEVALYDLTGRARWLSKKGVAAGGSSLSLDAGGLPAGVYLARATVGGKSVTVKVVKVD